MVRVFNNINIDGKYDIHLLTYLLLVQVLTARLPPRRGATPGGGSGGKYCHIMNQLYIYTAFNNIKFHKCNQFVDCRSFFVKIVHIFKSKNFITQVYKID